MVGLRRLYYKLFAGRCHYREESGNLEYISSNFCPCDTVDAFATTRPVTMPEAQGSRPPALGAFHQELHHRYTSTMSRTSETTDTVGPSQPLASGRFVQIISGHTDQHRVEPCLPGSLQLTVAPSPTKRHVIAASLRASYARR